jgi:hypothetical protein
LPSISTTPTSVITGVVLVAIGIPTTIATTTNTGLIIVVFKALLPPIRSGETISKTKRTLVLHSGLLTSLLSRTSGVSFDSSSATQPLNAFSFE